MDSDQRPLLDSEWEDLDPFEAQRIEDVLELEIPPCAHGTYGRQVLHGYSPSSRGTVLTWLCVLLSCGLLLLLFHWWPRLKLYCTHSRCPLRLAHKLLVLETYQSKCTTYHIKDVKIMNVHGEEKRFSHRNVAAMSANGHINTNTVKLHLEDGTAREVITYRAFRSKKVSFVWDDHRQIFLRMVGLEKSTRCIDFHSVPGYSADQQAKIRLVYGVNEIGVPVQSVLTLIVLEFFNPFYMFQVFTIGVWLAENYYYYSVAIVIMSVFGITTSVIQTRKNQRNLRSTVQSTGEVQVCRDKTQAVYETVDSSQLVPGDVILIPSHGCTMHVDAVLLDGSCIVNESMLTGESVPVTKTAVPHVSRVYDIKDDSSHTLYCGTSVIQTRYYNNEPVKAVVLRTGFLTTKGQLVRSIMYPLPADFKFDRDSYKFIIILSVLALFGLIYTIALKSGRSISVSDVIIKSLDILTIVVPPALPAAMTVGRLYAVSRLRKAGVFCINPRVINVCGSIACVCFDKTGTLTEDGLDLWGIVPSKILKKQSGTSRSSAETLQKRDSQNSGPDDMIRYSLAEDNLSPIEVIDNCFEKALKDVENNAEKNEELDIIEEETSGDTDGKICDVEYIGGFDEGDRLRRLSEQRHNGAFDDFEVLEGDVVTLVDPVKDPSQLDDEDLIKIGMNVCHSLTVLNGELTGDPLDVKMFESTGWLLEEPKVPDTNKFDLLFPTVVRSPLVNGETTSRHEWGIVQQFQFSSSLQRSGVICRSLTSDTFLVFCKGSPEMIMALSKPETVPSGMKHSLRAYTQQGYRVLALGFRPLHQNQHNQSDHHPASFLKAQRMPREEAEADLNFLGLVIMENRVKPQSEPVIRELKEADIRVVMITGDNLDTAVSVAGECGMLDPGERLVMCEAVPSEDKGMPPTLYYTHSIISVQGLRQSKTNPQNVPNMTKVTPSAIFGAAENSSSNTDLCPPSLASSSSSSLEVEAPNHHQGSDKVRLALTGSTWHAVRTHYPQLVPRLVTAGVVFARMSSDQKQQLVQELQGLGYYVAMCGDGANDCGALKAAHAGISVSGQESSVASPFTSREGHVGCVPLVIRQGRAALATSFGMFKFMVAYSLAEFLSVAFLYYFDSNLTDFQFLFIDVALIVNFAFFFGKTEAYAGPLHKIPPGTSLLGFVPLFSMIVQILIAAIFQALAYIILIQYSWYDPHTYQGDIAYLSHENYAIFCSSMFQYIILSIVFSRGAPYRKSIVTNYVFMTSLIIMTAICVYITVYPADWLISLLELKVPPEMNFRYIILGLAVVNFFVSLFAEKFVVEYLLEEKKMLPKRLQESHSKSLSHKSVEREMENESNWPPVSNGRTPSQDVITRVDERQVKVKINIENRNNITESAK